MRVTCPNCLTEYDVPDEAIAGRPRTVRCAHCGHQWRHGAPAADEVSPADDVTAQNPAPDAAPLIDAPPLLPPTEPAPSGFLTAPRAGFTASRAPLPPPPPRRNAKPAIIALLILALVVIVLAAHRPIMRLWPASAGFYQALGLG